jgi:hypothetical protein
VNFVASKQHHYFFLAAIARFVLQFKNTSSLDFIDKSAVIRGGRRAVRQFDIGKPSSTRFVC